LSSGLKAPQNKSHEGGASPEQAYGSIWKCPGRGWNGLSRSWPRGPKSRKKQGGACQATRPVHPTRTIYSKRRSAATCQFGLPLPAERNPAPGPKFDYKLRWFGAAPFLRLAQRFLKLDLRPVVLAGGDYTSCPRKLTDGLTSRSGGRTMLFLFTFPPRSSALAFQAG